MYSLCQLPPNSSCFNKYIINVTTTEINTCKQIFEFGQREVISFFTLVTNKGEQLDSIYLLLNFFAFQTKTLELCILLSVDIRMLGTSM
jgi:hypothetical protein